MRLFGLIELPVLCFEEGRISLLLIDMLFFFSPNTVSLTWIDKFPLRLMFQANLIWVLSLFPNSFSFWSDIPWEVSCSPRDRSRFHSLSLLVTVNNSPGLVYTQCAWCVKKPGVLCLPTPPPLCVFWLSWRFFFLCLVRWRRWEFHLYLFSVRSFPPHWLRVRF